MQYARSKYPTQLAKMSFDEILILDLTADVFSFYYIINMPSCTRTASRMQSSGRA